MSNYKTPVPDEDKLVNDNINLVHHVLKKFSNIWWADYDDLFQIGCIGLLSAVRTFDKEKGIQFATYATACISNDLLTFIRRSNASNRKANYNCVLFSTVVHSSERNDLTLDQVLTDETATETIEELEYNIALKQVFNSVVLSDRENQVLELRNKDMSQYDIAELLGITQSYVSRIEMGAIKKLRKKAAC